MTEVHGLVLDEDDLAAARRCAHEALVLVVGEIAAADAEDPLSEADSVMAHARLVHALGTETDPRGPLLLVSAGDAGLLLEGARRVEEDLREGLGQAGGNADDRRERYERTIAAARRVLEITELRAA
jgi:hypothetical protein